MSKTENNITTSNIAFIGWNPFQMMHVMSIAQKLKGSCFVLENRGKHIFKFAEELLSSCGVPVVIWPRNKIFKLDGLFDIIVCQTPFSQIEMFKKSKIVMIQYGYAKEVHNYGPWRAWADMCLVYGNYAAEKLEKYCKIEKIGNPAMDEWHEEVFHIKQKKKYAKSLNPKKKTLLYVPTWGKLSTYDKFIKSVLALSKTYNILLKLHHLTGMLWLHRKKKIVGGNILVFGQNDRLLDLLAVSDIVLSDYSGAIFDALYCEKPIVLLHDDIKKKIGAKINLTSLEYANSSSIGSVVEDTNELEHIVEKVVNKQINFSKVNVELTSELYIRGPEATSRAVEALKRFIPIKLNYTNAELNTKREFIMQHQKIKTVSNNKKDIPLKKEDLTKGIYRNKHKILMHTLPSIHLNISTQKRFLSLICGQLKNELFRNLLFLFFKKCFWFHLAVAEMYREKDDDLKAFETLILAQRWVDGNYWIHLQLAVIYRDNAQYSKAYVHYKIAELLSPVYGTIRRLTFESDMKMFNCGTETINKIMKFSSANICKYLLMINRVAIFYPNNIAALVGVRSKQKENIFNSNVFKSSAALTQKIDLAINNWWLKEALALVSEGRKYNLTPSKYYLDWLNRIQTDLGDIVYLLDIAWKNENNDEQHAVVDGKAILLNKLNLSNAKVIEMFIPTVFFSKPTVEKLTYETIRKFFRVVIDSILEIPEVIVVPRLQFNWRSCITKTNGYAISYHTYSNNSWPSDRLPEKQNTECRHMHIQKSTLAGYCSMDLAGFAGFSSLATDYSSIDDFTDNVSDEQLNLNAQELYNEFVTQNISKYAQNKAGNKITGKYVFVALQVSSDIVSKLAWINGVELLRLVADYYKDSNTAVIVKRHPYCGSMSVQQAISQLSQAGNVTSTNASIHDLIRDAEVIFTVNSGVGLEALLHSKKVVVSGRCDYSYAAVSVKNSRQLYDCLNNDAFVSPTAIKRFLYFYRKRYVASSAEPNIIKKRIIEWLSLYLNRCSTKSFFGKNIPATFIGTTQDAQRIINKV